MIIVMQFNAQETQIATVIEQIHAAGLKEHVSRGAELVIIGVIGDEDRLNPARFEALPGVERVSRITKQYKIVSRATQPTGTQFKVRGITIGGEQIQIFAGVRAASSAEHLEELVASTRAAGGRLLWSALEDATSTPYEFHEIEYERLIRLRELARSHAMPFAIELNDLQALEVLLAHDVDLIQLGAQSMQNRPLLRELGRINKPIVLRRGLASTVTEWLLAAETIAAGGNHHIILCEQGAKGSLDVATIVQLKRETYLPIIVDVSHAGGRQWMIPALALAAVAAGADGLMVDVHSQTFAAQLGTDQAITASQFERLMATLRAIAPTLGRSI